MSCICSKSESYGKTVDLGFFLKQISYRTCAQGYYLPYRQNTRCKWHFNNFTGEPKQKRTIGWSDFVHWFQSFIINICILLCRQYTVASRKSSPRALIWYIYKYIYIYPFPKMSLTLFWFSPLVVYNYSNESFCGSSEQNAYFIAIIG